MAECAYDAVAQLFAALADPCRLRLVRLLADRELSVSGVVGETGFKQAAVSKQLAQLHGVGILERRRDGRNVLYKISDPDVLTICQVACAKLKRDGQAQLERFDGLTMDG